MKQKFSELTVAQLLTVDNETLNDAIRLEAIHRGIAPPVTLSEAIRSSEWVGYQRPAEAMTVFEIVYPGQYNHQTESGIAYLNKESAENAMQGMVFVIRESYPTKVSLGTAAPSIRQTVIGVSLSESKGVKFEEFVERDKKEFDALVLECMELVSSARQDDYNRRVMIERRAEYLRLAGGNEEIAAAFWAKAERTEWPAA